MFLVILALLVTAAVADVAVESALADGTAFVAGGRELATGLDPEIVTLSIAAAMALAGILLVVTIGAYRRRHRTIRYTTRKEELSQAEAALEARRQLIEGRLDELQRNHDSLLRRRDELLDEIEHLKERHEELEERVRERHRDIAAARKALDEIDTVVDVTAEPDEDLTVVPDVEASDTEPQHS